MKKLFMAITVAVLSLSLLAACGGSLSQQSEVSNSSSSLITPDVPEVPAAPEGTGGEFYYEYEGDFRRDLRMFGLTLTRNVCGDANYNEWSESFNVPWEENDPNKRPYEECTLITFIKDFNVPKEDFKEFMTYDGVCTYTDAEIDIMYHGTKAQQAAEFANFTAIAVGENIYTPKWIATHSAAQVKAAGITAAMLESKSEVWNEIFINSPHLAKLQAVTAERKALN